jgi:hypothetical protein
LGLSTNRGSIIQSWPLLFSADDDGDLVGLDAKTGKALWHFAMGSNLKASSMTFSVGGRQ